MNLKNIKSTYNYVFFYKRKKIQWWLVNFYAIIFCSKWLWKGFYELQVTSKNSICAAGFIMLQKIWKSKNTVKSTKCEQEMVFFICF